MPDFTPRRDYHRNRYYIHSHWTRLSPLNSNDNNASSVERVEKRIKREQKNSSLVKTTMQRRERRGRKS